MAVLNRRQVIIFGIVLAGSIVAGAPYLRREVYLRDLTRGENKRQETVLTAEQSATYERFVDLWFRKSDSDVVPKLISMLNTSNLQLTSRIVKALGRLEDPSAEKPLQHLLERAKRVKDPQATLGVSKLTLDLALSRIRTRKLQGERRLISVSKAIGLSLSEVTKLSQLVYANRNSSAASEGSQIVDEFIDIMYSMGKKGDNIDALSHKFSLKPPEKIYLKGASLSTEAEIELIIDYAIGRDGVSGGDIRLIQNHLLALGPKAVDKIIYRLERFQQERGDYGNRGYVTLFRAAIRSGDPRVLKPLKVIAKDSDRWVGFYARQAIRFFEQKAKLPDFPA